ncbi:MAG: primosomal protein N' [Synechococcaceae cyanobacterium SM2_3_2]|nr:primosomal protein N' [Synechococcaceae cyanobacterium SM2_3_2]
MPLFCAPSAEGSPWLEVWVDAPQGGGCYTYGLGEFSEVQPGDIVTVPFGSQMVGGVALRRVEQLPEGMSPERVRPIADVVGSGLLPPTFWPLLERVADYYLTPLAAVLKTVLPPGILARSQRRVKLLEQTGAVIAAQSGPAQEVLDLLASKRGDLAWRFVQQRIPGAAASLKYLQQQGLVSSYWQPQHSTQPKFQQAITLCQEPDQPLSPTQQTLLTVLRQNGGDLWLSDLLSQAAVSRSVAQSLARKGIVRITKRHWLRTSSDSPISRDQAKVLTPEQQTAVAEIQQSLKGSHRWLLYGVTGSGKTEVYLQVIAKVLAQGSSALVLVPEIGLTPQLLDRFRARFGSQVLVYHSGLSVGERFDSWRQMLTPIPQVVIGTRSAVFAPFPQLGLIILDEEHDDSYKQDQPQPCYHARQVAFWRSELEGCPIVLGSATPAVETYHAAQQQQIQIVEMPHRIRLGGDPLPMPQITLVDMREELHKRNFNIFSGYLRQALEETIAQGQQAILFVPRRGHSTFVSCRSCGEPLTCPDCDVSLTFHSISERLRCHYCGYQQDHPDQCPACGSPILKHFGSGTQKVVEALAGLDPTWRILRFDSDSTQRKGSHRLLLQQFRDGGADILVGTQMLTKGLDVPQVTLVGVIAADGILNMADFRASERTFQLITQVAGRAGRGSLPGRAIIQTYLPDHPTLQAIQHYDYGGFIQAERQQRQEAGFPPWRSMVLIRLSSSDLPALESFAHDLRHHLDTIGIPGEILGPCPAQVQRVSGVYRWQILLKEPSHASWDRQQLNQDLRALVVPTGIRLSLDVDPLRIL